MHVRREKRRKGARSLKENSFSLFFVLQFVDHEDREGETEEWPTSSHQKGSLRPLKNDVKNSHPTRSTQFPGKNVLSSLADQPLSNSIGHR